jgi:hypothetical protein
MRFKYKEDRDFIIAFSWLGVVMTVGGIITTLGGWVLGPSLLLWGACCLLAILPFYWLGNLFNDVVESVRDLFSGKR